MPDCKCWLAVGVPIIPCYATISSLIYSFALSFQQRLLGKCHNWHSQQCKQMKLKWFTVKQGSKNYIEKTGSLISPRKRWTQKIYNLLSAVSSDTVWLKWNWENSMARKKNFWSLCYANEISPEKLFIQL